MDFLKEFEQERKEHPKLPDSAIAQIVRDHAAKECPPPDLAWELKQGVKEHIQGVTKKNPWYALVSGALQGLPADYTASQEYVDQIAAKPPENWLDAEKTAQYLNSHLTSVKKKQRFQFSRLRAPVIAEMAKCYLGEQRLGRSPRDAAWNCAGPTYKGIKRKASNLMREYLGDDQAVAADRHVYIYTCVKHGVCPPLRSTNKGIMIPESSQKVVEAKIKDIAKKCGLAPADVQVAAWTRGACDSRRTRYGKNPRKAVLYLGRDVRGKTKTVHCNRKVLEGRGDTTPSVNWKNLPPTVPKLKGMKMLEDYELL